MLFFQIFLFELIQTLKTLIKNRNLQYDYYYNTTEGKYKPCYNLCKGCIGDYIEEKNEMNCRNCIDNYYLIRNTTNCINETYASENHYLAIRENDKIKFFVGCYFSCNSCSGIYDENTKSHNCISCNNNFYFLNNSKNCYDETFLNEGYYIKNNIIYPCKYNCLTCFDEGTSINDQKCDSCLNYFYLDDNNNCVRTCPKYLYEYNGFCYYSCPQNFFKDIKNKKCLNQCPENTIINYEDKSCYNQFDFNNIELNNLNDYIDDLLLYFNDPEYIIKKDDFYIQIYDINIEEETKKKSNEEKISYIDFNECENKLKEYYNITEIIIMKIDSKNPNLITNKVDYFLYDYNGNELNISICEEKSIKIYSPIVNLNSINLNELIELNNLGYDIFNAEDEFYNNICTRFSSQNNTDVTLKDRRKNYYPNISLCNENCNYEGIDYDNLIVKCNCETKNKKTLKESTFDHDIKLNVNNVKNVFKDNLFNSNIQVVKCTKLIFNKKYIFKNYGFWIISSFIFIEIILFIFYCKIGNKPIKNYMQLFIPKNNPPKILSSSNTESNEDFQITEKINLNENKLENNKTNNNNTENDYLESNHTENNNLENHNNNSNNHIDNIYSQTRENFIILNQNNIQTEKSDIEEKYNKNINMKISTPIKIKVNSSNSMDKYLHSKNNSIYSDVVMLKDNDKNINKKTKKKKKSKNENYSIEDFLDFSYEESLKKDKRTFIKIYWNYLQLQHIILNTFFLESYLELRIIKIYFLIFSFGLEFTLNALFYTDKYISDLYYNNGVLNFFSNLPKAIYSFLVSILINFFLVKLSNSKNEFKNILSRNYSKEDFNLIIQREFKCLQKKLIIFYLVTSILFLFFWYYSNAFCAVYYNSQKFWALAGLETFIFNLITPFIFCIFISSLRFFSLKYQFQFLYQIEQIINLFI